MLRKLTTLLAATVFACFAVMGPGMAFADVPGNAEPSAEVGGAPPEVSAPVPAPSASAAPVVVNVEAPAPAPAPAPSPFGGVSFLAAVAAAVGFVIANISAIMNLAVLAVRPFDKDLAQKIRSATPFAVALAKPDGKPTTQKVIELSRNFPPGHYLRDAVDDMAKALGMPLPADPVDAPSSDAEGKDALEKALEELLSSKGQR